MIIYKIMRRTKRMAAPAAMALLLLAGAAMTGCGAKPVELAAMTEAQIARTETELTKTLGVNGVKLFELYDEETEEREQRSFALAVTVVRGGDDPADSLPGKGTVTYQIYDLEEGLPKKSSEPMQTLTAEEYAFPNDAPLTLGDMNFDGALDIKLFLWAGAQNSQGVFYLWNEEEGLFVENEALGRLTSPLEKPEYGVIHEHIHVSGFEATDNLYVWEGDALVPFRKIEQKAPLGNANALEGLVFEWFDGCWEPMYERKVVLSRDWTQADYDKMEDLTKELAAWYDPEYIGF